VADFVSGVKNIGPAFPVKPVQPSSRDRKSGTRQKKPSEQEQEPDGETTTDEQKSTIDEYI
jgi:hypothetical protein